MQIHLYRIRLRTLGVVHFDKFPGIPLEGAVAGGIRSLSCGCRPEMEGRCPLRRRCTQNLVVRPRRELFPDLGRRFGSPPSPLVLRPRFVAGTYERGEELELEVVLVGWANDHFRWVLAGLVEAVQRGVGPARRQGRQDGRLEVAAVESVGPRGEVGLWADAHPGRPAPQPWRYPDDFMPPETAPSSRGTFTVEFRSPTFLKAAGTGRPPTLGELVSALCRRLSVLSQTHGDRHEAGYEEASRLEALASGVGVDAAGCRWERSDRFSRRQDQTIPMNGCTGWIRYRGDPEPFLPLLRLGALLHVGKHTIRGYGEIGLRDLP